MKLNGNGNGSNQIGTIGAVIAIIVPLAGVIFGISSILSARMDFLQAQIIEQKHLNEKFETADKESLTDRSEMKVKFTEVETQFRWQREVSDKADDVLIERMKKLEDRR